MPTAPTLARPSLASMATALLLAAAALPAAAQDGGTCTITRAPDPAPATAPTGAAATMDIRLRQITAARDLPAFMDLLDPDVRISFGVENGRDHFAETWLSDEEEFWGLMERMLGFGGTHVRRDGHESVVYPYYFETWNGEGDPFTTYFDAEGKAYTADATCDWRQMQHYDYISLVDVRMYLEPRDGGWVIAAFIAGD